MFVSFKSSRIRHVCLHAHDSKEDIDRAFSSQAIGTVIPITSMKKLKLQENYGHPTLLRAKANDAMFPSIMRHCLEAYDAKVDIMRLNVDDIDHMNNEEWHDFKKRQKHIKRWHLHMKWLAWSTPIGKSAKAHMIHMVQRPYLHCRYIFPSYDLEGWVDTK